MPPNKTQPNDETHTDGSDELEVKRLIIKMRQQRMLAHLGKTIKEIETDFPEKSFDAND
jgi:hypothetical protein